MWYKKSPTIEDVKICQYWWNKSSNGSDLPTILNLDVSNGRIIIVESPKLDNEFPFVAEEWGDEWAPCVSPPNGPTPDLMSPNEPCQQLCGCDV